jgi:aminotransferase
MLQISEKAKPLKQSGIRAASIRCKEIGGINLGQGICDMPIHPEIKQAAHNAITEEKNIYSPCEGILPLREAIAKKIKDFNKLTVDPVNEVMVTHGSTGAYVAAVLTLFNPGDEIILFEPFYGYHKHVLELHGMCVKTVAVATEDFSIDMDALKKAISKNTRGIVICTPCNPSGKVFTKNELLAIGALAKQHALCVITDEIYEYIVYPGHQHISFASLEDFKDRTITISGFSKTYNMTGWRLGYASGPAEIINKMALVHDLIYVCPVTPLQYAVLAALTLDNNYYQALAKKYLHKRDMTVNTLRDLGFKITAPQGAYYLMADFSNLDFKDDVEAVSILLEKAKVATVTGRSFFSNADDGKKIIRVCYALEEEKVVRAMEQMKVAKFN